MPAPPSSTVPAALAALSPLSTPDTADLRPCPAKAPDPRSHRGRWHPLARTLTVCARAVTSGTRTVEETTGGSE